MKSGTPGRPLQTSWSSSDLRIHWKIKSGPRVRELICVQCLPFTLLTTTPSSVRLNKTIITHRFDNRPRRTGEATEVVGLEF